MHLRSIETETKNVSLDMQQMRSIELPLEIYSKLSIIGYQLSLISHHLSVITYHLGVISCQLSIDIGKSRLL